MLVHFLNILLKFKHRKIRKKCREDKSADDFSAKYYLWTRWSRLLVHNGRYSNLVFIEIFDLAAADWREEVFIDIRDLNDNRDPWISFLGFSLNYVTRFPRFLISPPRFYSKTWTMIQCFLPPFVVRYLWMSPNRCGFLDSQWKKCHGEIYWKSLENSGNFNSLIEN